MDWSKKNPPLVGGGGDLRQEQPSEGDFDFLIFLICIQM